MSAFIWALVAIGVLFLLGSFFVSEKLSRSDLEKIREVSENEVRTILENELDKADEKIRDSIDEKTMLAMDRAESAIEHQTNETLMGISEFSDTVLESMNKSHTEIMFMYDSLSGKQEELTNLTRDVQLLQSAITLDKKELIEKTGRLDEVMAELENEQNALAIQKRQLEEELASRMSEVSEAASSEAPRSSEEVAPEDETAPGDETGADDSRSLLPGRRSDHFKRNDEILRLGAEGKSPVEIAKALGMGLGEVKLVLELERKKGEA